MDLALRLQPDSGELWFWSARHHSLNDRHGNALSDYERALTSAPKRPEYLYGLLHHHWQGQGEDWRRSAQSPEVVEVIQSLSETARTARQLNAVAAHQLLSSNVEAALATSAEACRLEPDCWSCFHNRAAALFAAGDGHAARDAEAEALTLLPEAIAFEMSPVLRHALDYYTTAVGSGMSEGNRPGLIAP